MAQTPEQYINPIIQAMLKDRELKQQAGQNASNLQLEKEKQKQDEQYKDQLLKESQSRIDETTRRNQAEEDIKQQIAQEAHTRAGSDLYMKAAQAVHGAPKGINPDSGKPYAQEALENFAKFHGGTVNSGSSPQLLQQGPAPGGGPQASPISPSVSFPQQGISNVTPAGFPTEESDVSKAQELNDIKSNAAKDLLKQKLVQQHENALALDAQKAQNGMQLQSLKGVQNERAKNIAGQYQLSAANINRDSHLKAIELLHGLGMNGDMVPGVAEHGRAIYEGVIHGDLLPSKLSKEEKAVGGLWAQANGTVMPNDDKYKEGLNTLDYTQNLINRYRDFAKQFSKDAPGGGLIEMQKKGQLGGLITPSPLNVSLDSLNADAVRAATAYSGIKRQNMAEIVLGIKGAIDPRRTTPENLDNIDKYEQKQVPLIRSLFPTGMSDDYINKVLTERGITLGQGGVPQASTAAPSAPKTNPRTPAPPQVERHPNNPAYIKNPATGKYSLDPNYSVPPLPTQSSTGVQPAPQGIQQ